MGWFQIKYQVLRDVSPLWLLLGCSDKLTLSRNDKETPKSQTFGYIMSCHVTLWYVRWDVMSCHVIWYHIILDLQMSVWVKDSGDWKALLHVIIQGLRHLLTYDSAWHLVIRIYAIHLSDEVRECGGFCQRVLWTRYGSGVLYFCLHPISWNSTTWCQLTMTVDWNVGQLWVPGKIRLDEDIAFSLPRWPFCSSNIHFTVSLHVEQTPFLRETT